MQIFFVLQQNAELSEPIYGNRPIVPTKGPYFLFITSILLAATYFWLLLKQGKKNFEQATTVNKVIGFALGAATILITFGVIRKLFWDFPNPENISDVVPQIDVLYDRFVKGEMPYYPLEQFGWHPFPVYMPLHWLPLAVPKMLGIDIRWIGAFLLVLAVGYYGILVWRDKTTAIYSRVLALILPFIALQGYLQFGRLDLAVSFEIIIGAYYLLLAVGLAAGSLPITIAGIIVCMLSRYTMVFWVPLFAILLWFNQPRKYSFIAWGSVAAAFLVFYIIPFLIKEPSILANGVAYHNGCAVAEWVGYGEPPVSWTFTNGISFAPELRNAFSGDMEHRVFLCRALQAGMMLGLLGLGLLLYRIWKDRISYYDLSLGFLYLVLLCFFMFGPLTYKYYFFPLLMVSATMCAKMMLSKTKVD
jgi:hypothetical protein